MKSGVRRKKRPSVGAACFFVFFCYFFHSPAQLFVITTADSSAVAIYNTNKTQKMDIFLCFSLSHLVLIFFVYCKWQLQTSTAEKKYSTQQTVYYYYRRMFFIYADEVD